MALVVGGYAPPGSAATSNPVIVGGTDTTNTTRIVKTATDGTVAVSTTSVVDSNNSSTTALIASAAFTGTGTDVLGYQGITVTVFANQTGTLTLQWSQDNTTFKNQVSASVISAADPQVLSIVPVARYFRVFYQNGGSSQGTFQLQTILHPFALAVTAAQPAASATLSTVAASATAVVLLVHNNLRKNVTVYNDSTSAMYLAYDTTVSTSSFTVKILSGGYWEMPLPVYAGQIDVMWDSAVGNARVTEQS